MDCYFHSNVPSVAPCADCNKPVCAICRDDNGSCPSCRLAAKVEAATATRQQIGGRVPPRPSARPAVVTKAEIAVPSDPLESRALVALGYPLWPLALLSLFDRKQSRYLRMQAIQALGFNLGMFGFWGLLSVLSNVPFLGFSAGVLIPFLIPLFLVASVYFGIKTWNGDDVRVPIISGWIEDHFPSEKRVS